MLCSACLLGVKCRYNGEHKLNKKVLEIAKKEALVPVCPEQLAGFPTPRETCEIKNGKVITKNGEDLTEKFIKGAEEVVKIAKLLGVKKAILKEGSPSCGVKRIPDDTFSGKKVPGSGITAEILKNNGIEVISEDEI